MPVLPNIFIFSVTPRFTCMAWAVVLLRHFTGYDFGSVSALKRDVIILEIGTNDLVANRSDVAGSEIGDLVQLLLQSYSVWVIGVCEVIPCVRAPFFNGAAPILNQYLHDVPELRPNAFSWRHTSFSNPKVSPYSPDGVRLNARGQYSHYRSYRGAILKALRSPWFSHHVSFLFPVFCSCLIVLGALAALVFYFIWNPYRLCFCPSCRLVWFIWGPCCSCLFFF